MDSLLLYPNNRMRIYDNSLTPEPPKVPDFKDPLFTIKQKMDMIEMDQVMMKTISGRQRKKQKN